MPPHSLWKGAVTFGMVHLPVALYPAQDAAEVDLDLLDRRDHSPVGYRKVNKNTGQEVPPSELARGYRLESGEYVLVDDVRRDAGDRAHTIEIKSFVAPGEIRPAFFETPYFLEPTPEGDRAYALLREALSRTGRIGIAQVMLRTRLRLAAVVPDGPLLVLNLLRYPSQLRDPSALRTPGSDLAVGAREMKMAERLIEDLTEPWKPERFKDEAREEFLAAVRKKAEAGEAVPPREAPAGPARPRAGDLMTLLKESVSRAEQTRRRRSKSA